MQISWVSTAVVFVLLVSAVVLWAARTRKKSSSAVIAFAQPQNVVRTQALETDRPSQIIIGENPANPLVTIEAIEPSSAAYREAKRVNHSVGALARLSSLVQAAPALLVAGEASGKRLMEVVVNGDLVKAADGNGLLGFTKGAGGKIKEHARLFEASNLQNVINAAAVWQIASVVVAQKHLADISQKLDEIKKGVENISRFLDTQRRARVQSTYEYLGQARMAIEAGELPVSVRTELEACERDLLEIQLHLEKEFQAKVEARVEHKEMMGTKDLAADIHRKIDELDALAQDISTCMRTRIAAWHVLSLYPGEPHLKAARRQSIERGIESFQGLSPTFRGTVDKEIAGVKSFWNFASTLESRKDALEDKCRSVHHALVEKVAQGKVSLERSSELLLADSRPTRVFLEWENGVVVGARQA
jgi:hypothetical protein